MIVRAVDSNNDWTFGKGKNNYKSKNDAVAQDIQTRLLSFLGDCFFDINSGIDWFNLLGGKDDLALRLSISAVILNTENVTGLKQISFDLTDDRQFTVSYTVQTTYSVIQGTFQYDLNGIG